MADLRQKMVKLGAMGAAAALLTVLPGTVRSARADSGCHVDRGCARDDDGRPRHGLHVHVSTAADLQCVAGDPSYANVRIVLAPGTYNLVQPKPAKGAPPSPLSTLSLQPGQSIFGQQRYLDRDHDGVPDPIDPAIDPGDPAANYVVKGSATLLQLPHVDTTLPPCSHPYAAGDTAATCNDFEGDTAGIRMQNGNSIEGVTVRGTGAVEESNNNRNAVKCMYSSAPSHESCRILNSVIQHVGGGFGGAGNLVEIIGSVIQDNSGAMEVGFGNGFTGGVSNVVMTGNRVTGSGSVLDDQGNCCVVSGGNAILFNNYAASGNAIYLTTSGNVVDRNTQNGFLLMAALSFGGNGHGSGNTIEWTSIGDKITRNGWGDGNDCLSATPQFCGYGSGGVMLIAANENNSFDLQTGQPIDNPIPSASSNNKVIVHLIGTSFVSDKGLAGPGNQFAGFPVDLASIPEASSTPTVEHDNVISVTTIGVSAPSTPGYYNFWVLDDTSVPVVFPGSMTRIWPRTEAAFDRINSNFAWPLCNNASPASTCNFVTEGASVPTAVR